MLPTILLLAGIAALVREQYLTATRGLDWRKGGRA